MDVNMHQLLAAPNKWHVDCHWLAYSQFARRDRKTK